MEWNTSDPGPEPDPDPTDHVPAGRETAGRIAARAHALLATLRDQDSGPPGTLGPARRLIRCLAATASADNDDSAAQAIEKEAQRIRDPEVARATLQALGSFHRSLWLERQERAGNVEHARTIARVAGFVARAQERLLDHWFRHESAERSEWLARAVHDLRSPLTSIVFLSEALHSGQAGRLATRHRTQLRLIDSAARTVLTLVDNILSDYRLRSTGQGRALVPFSVRSTWEEVDRALRPLAQVHQLVLQVDQRCVSARHGDPEALSRILLNLVTNAIRHTDEGGVSVRFVEVEDDLLVEVEDTGPGFGEEAREELFTPYRTGANVGPGEAGSRFSGYGLGLSICHRLVRRLDGAITVASEPGVGSLFRVRLPFPPLITGDAGAAAPAQADRPSNGRRAT